MSIRVLDSDGALIAIAAKPQRATLQLELCGELPCWEQPIAMQRAGGAFEARVRMAPGVYEAKLREPGGEWFVDAAWRTVERDGERNGVIVVGGTEEPVLHAPAAPWLELREDGRLVVRAALRRDAGTRLVLRFGDERRAMRAVGGDTSHLWFETELAGAVRQLEYAFVLGDGRMVGGSLRVTLRDLAGPVPAWWRDAVVYTIFVDRFRRAGGTWRDPSVTARELRAGGELAGVIEALPYLADLGVTALHLTPICVAPSVHRYDAIDPTTVDPDLGGEAAFDELLDAAHARGMRVLVDVAATHVHRDFEPFRDVRAKGPQSSYWPWFQVHRWPFVDGYDPGYVHYQKGQWQEPLLALDEPEVQDTVTGWFAAWVERGADGVRVDAAADLPLTLLGKIRAAVRAIRSDAVVFGEVVPACVQHFAPHVLDAATDFAHREALVDWLRGASARWTEVAALQRWRGAAGHHALGFTSTHDQPRVRTVTRDADLARLGLVATALGARVPMLYYGDEVGLHAETQREFEDAWPDRQPMPWREAQWDSATHAAVKGALALRKAHDLLRHGDEEVRPLGNDTVVVRRFRLGDAIEIVIHRGSAPREVALHGAATLLLAIGDARLAGAMLQLGAKSLAVLDYLAPSAPAPELRIANAEIAREAYTRGMPETPAYPTRLYVTVTEACNLRCAHCITDAPARTQSGRARTLQPWLLDALAEPFAHADYVGFTHGGETLAAPIFPEVLRAIARGRAGRPGKTDVHLVTNGMLLDEDRVASLADLGVDSIMVSLDGATAATNDRIRVLGKFDRVVANLGSALALRARKNLDLRIGLSFVIGASNHRELPALGKLCLDLGVDWLKVEETYPATPFARRDLLAPSSREVTVAMSALRDVLAGKSIVLVDHVDPPRACSCTGDPAAVAFRTADDYANRFRFCACRAPWEQAAIDPDGTVHVVDYFGAPLGNLLDATFLDLWNAPAALASRTR